MTDSPKIDSLFLNFELRFFRNPCVPELCFETFTPEWGKGVTHLILFSL